MRDALKGMVVAGLPGGGWRSESLLGGAAASLWPQPAPAPAPAPRPPTVHLDTSNPSAPIVVEGAGHIAGDPAERDDEPPIPPEDIPGHAPDAPAAAMTGILSGGCSARATGDPICEA